jgi:peptidoglycan-associated lipoprotein
MKAKGYGRDRLVGDCADIECTAQNRRVITNPQEEPDF